MIHFPIVAIPDDSGGLLFCDMVDRALNDLALGIAFGWDLMWVGVIVFGRGYGGRVRCAVLQRLKPSMSTGTGMGHVSSIACRGAAHCAVVKEYTLAKEHTWPETCRRGPNNDNSMHLLRKSTDTWRRPPRHHLDHFSLFITLLSFVALSDHAINID